VDILDLLSVLLQGPSSGISIPSWRWVVLFLVVAGLLTAVVLLAPTEERNKRGQVVYCVLAVAAGVGILSHYYALKNLLRRSNRKGNRPPPGLHHGGQDGHAAATQRRTSQRAR
jgi:hypothetical protein